MQIKQRHGIKKVHLRSVGCDGTREKREIEYNKVRQELIRRLLLQRSIKETHFFEMEVEVIIAVLISMTASPEGK